MSKNINLDKIRSLDVFFSADISFFAFIEKWSINGIGKALTDSCCKLPVHVGWFVNVMGGLKIFEMAEDKNDHGVMRLTENHISKYDNNGWFGDRIVAVKRFAMFEDPALRAHVEAKIIGDEASGNVLYDIKELFDFPGFHWLHQMFPESKNKTICSGYVRQVIQSLGYDFPINHGATIAPYDIYNSDKIFSDETGLVSNFSFVPDIYV